jgi:hypothetical protein
MQTEISMKRLLITAALGLTAAPAFAQTPEADLQAFAARYVDLFNKGDIPTLAKDFYDGPGISTADMQARLTRQLANLRADEFGKMTLYGAKPCMHGQVSAQLEVDFAYNFTYGGVMPPGDQATVFEMRKGEQGWRIVGTKDLPAGQGFVCSL